MGSHTLETVALNDAFASASGGFHAALWAGFEAHEVVPQRAASVAAAKRVKGA